MNSVERLNTLLELPRESLETPEVISLIRAILDRDEEARQHYIRWCAFEVGLHRALGGENVDRSAIVSQIQRQQRQATTRFLTCSLIVSVLLFLGGRFWISRVEFSNRYQEALRIVGLWETPGETGAAEGGQRRFPLIRAGDRRQIPGGRFLIHFDSGAIASCVGSVDLEIVNGWELYVHRGNVCVQVPPRAHGFRVNTDSAQIVDLGTLFGVQADSWGTTEVHVISGRVQVAPQDSPPFEIASGRACRVNCSTQVNEKIAANADTFSSQLSSLAGVASLSGQVRFLSKPPASVSIQDFVTDETGWLFKERTGVTLTAPLAVGRPKPGIYTTNRPKIVDLPAGTTVSSYLIHVEGSDGTSVEGIVTFDQPILGFIFSTAYLDETDLLLGLPEVVYPSAEPSKARNSSRGTLEQLDLLEVLPDRRTIRVKMSHRGEGSGLDQLRILTRNIH